MKPLFLVGYMGCGKSTLGRKAARRVGCRFADTDALLEQREGASVADVYQLAGEEYFRRAERAVLDGLIDSGEPLVVSTGGGLPVWSDNMARMNAAGTTVYLRRSAEQIARRLSPYGRQKRPRLRGLSDTELVDFMRRDMAERDPFYAQAQLTVDCTGKSDAELVEFIVRHSGLASIERSAGTPDFE
ncbi:MAG: shikimate kinase [Alistipes senegalensis]|nr:shikimate kinase [Alistipes senegalensis]